MGHSTVTFPLAHPSAASATTGRWWSPSWAVCAKAWQGWTERQAVRRALRQAMRPGRSAPRRGRPFEVHPPRGRARVLLLGDSTGVGVGALRPEDRLCGLLAAEFPEIEIVNRCRAGARLAETQNQLAPLVAAGERFDLALLLVGGNDVLRLTPQWLLANQARSLLGSVRDVARRTVWMGCADIGSAPLFAPPLSWWLSWQTARTMRLLAREACAHKVDFIDFVEEGALFASDTGTFFADDGLHPSAACYRHCFEVLKRRTPLAAVLRRRPTAVPLASKQEIPHVHHLRNHVH
jgi:lysophospholipase L1-like esterase